jgi:DNA-binding NarL/FixJ family response regulator
MAAPRIHVLLCGDDMLVRSLAGEPGMAVVGLATDEGGVQELPAGRAPDVVVLPVSMACSNGIRATRHVLAKRPSAKVGGICSCGHGTLASEMLQAGASGCVCREHAAEEIGQAIRAVLAGRVYVSPWIGGAVIGRTPPRAVRGVG